MARKHFNVFNSLSLAIKEIQIKITLRTHSIPVRMVIITDTNNMVLERWLSG